MSYHIPNVADATHSDQAAPDSTDIDTLVLGQQQTGVISGCAVVQRAAGANMSVDVAAGTASVAGAKVSVATGNITITAADATRPRWDLVSVSNAGTVTVTTGTAASQPAKPAIPATSAPLAAVYVAAAATSITNGEISDRRVVLPDLSITYVPELISGLSVQGWAATPVDASTVVNAAITAAYNRLATGGDQSGAMELVIPWAGVIYGSFKMMPGVSLRLGPKTMLAAMPSQTSAVVDYATNDAFHTTLRGGRIMGNNRNGATCRGIDMSSSSADAYAQPFPQATNAPDYPEIVDTTLTPAKWFNPVNRIENVFVYDIGGDRGVFIGRNQRGTVTNALRVNECKNIGVEIVGTDTQHHGLNVGVCSDNILVRGAATKIIGFKSWYAGRNTGYNTGHGDGIRVDTGTGAVGITDVGDTILIGETQDNARYGWAFLSGHGHHARGVTAGDAGCVFLGADGAGFAPTNCDIELVHSVADLGGPTSGVSLDTAGTSYNRVRLAVDPTHVDATWVPVKLTNSANLATNEVEVVYGAGRNYVNGGTVSGTYTPDTMHNSVVSLTVSSALTIAACPVSGVNAGRRQEISFDITTTGTGSVAWDASYVNASAIAANQHVFVTFYSTNRTSVASITWIKKS